MALHDVSAEALIAKTAVALKKDIKPPEWAIFVKTGHTRERPPLNPDWWYVRAASMLRRVAMIGPVGTEKLRTFYGGRKNLGHAPEHAYKGSGSVIRTILQQLDQAGLTKMAEKSQRKGRVVTPKGQALLYLLSDQIVKEAGPKQKVEPQAKPKAKPAESASN
jgi:small subunit ribosomal protein S19e